MKTAQQRLAWTLERCRRLAVRRTPVRERILAFLAEQRLPVTLEAVARAGDLRGQCDPATIYRSLMLFVDAQLVRQFRFHSKSSHFVLNLPGEFFHYFICTGCGALSELALSDHVHLIVNEIAAGQGYRADNHELILFGLCPRCHTAGRRATPVVKLMSRLNAAPPQPWCLAVSDHSPHPPRHHESQQNRHANNSTHSER